MSSTGQFGRDQRLLKDRDDPTRLSLARRVHGERRPESATAPASARTTPLKILTSVLLPEPFSPRSARISPGATSMAHEHQRLGRAVGFPQVRRRAEAKQPRPASGLGSPGAVRSRRALADRGCAGSDLSSDMRFAAIDGDEQDDEEAEHDLLDAVAEIRVRSETS